MWNNWADPDKVESKTQASFQGVVSSEAISTGRGSEAKEAFFHMMFEWFIEFVRTNLVVQWPPSPPIPQSAPHIPQGLEQVHMNNLPLINFVNMESRSFVV